MLNLLSWFADAAASTYRLISGAKIRLHSADDTYVGISPPTTADNTTYTLPPEKPTQDGQFLSSTTGGVLGWELVDLSSYATISQLNAEASIRSSADLALASDISSLASSTTTALAGKQPLDSDLTAIAALTTTSFGRSFLTVADAPAGITLLGLGTAALKNTGSSGDAVPLLNVSNTWSAQQTIQVDGLAVTADPGMTLINTTASTSLAGRQGAPGLILSGTQWNGSASIVDAWKIVTLPNSGSTVSSLLIQRSSNGAAYSNVFILTSGGGLTVNSLIANGTITGTNITAGATNTIGFTGRGSLTSDSSSNIVASAGLIVTGSSSYGFSGVSHSINVVSSRLQLNHTTSGTLCVTDGNTSLTQLYSPVSNELRVGPRDAASPVAQTLSVQSVVAGTSNTSAVNTTIIGSLSTGSGTSGNIIFKVGVKPGAGSPTVQATATTALTLTGETLAASFAGQITANASGTSIVCVNDFSLSGSGNEIVWGGGFRQRVIAAGQMRFNNSGNTSGFVLSNVTDNTCTILNRAGNAAGGVSADSLITTDPTSGTGPAWKLGAVKSGAVALDTANYVEVMINGVIKKLLISS